MSPPAFTTSICQGSGAAVPAATQWLSRLPRLGPGGTGRQSSPHLWVPYLLWTLREIYEGHFMLFLLVFYKSGIILK